MNYFTLTSCKWRIALLCFFISLSSNLVQAQDLPTGNPIVDVKELSNAINKLKTDHSVENAQAVLDYINANTAQPFASYDEMKTKLKADKNPISGIIDTINIRSINDVKKSLFIPTANNAGSQGFSIGKSAIDVAGTFIAERFKQEMEIAFLEKFKKWLQGDDNIGTTLRTLFPTTAKVFLQNDPYQYTTFLETLKESLNKDVNDLPVNIGIYLSANPFNIQSDFYFPAVLFYTNLVSIINGQSPILTLNSITEGNNQPLLDKSPQSVRSIVRLLSALSRTLTDPDADAPAFLSVVTIREAFTSIDKIKIFFGLFMVKEEVQLKDVVFGTKNLYQLIGDANNSKLESVAKWIADVDNAYVNLASKVEDMKISIANGKDGQGLVTVGLGAFTNAINIVLKFPFAGFGFDNAATQAAAKSMGDAATYFTNLSSIVVNIKDKNYGLAFTGVVEILVKEKVDQKAIDVIKKYGNFAVSVAKSKDKNEMLAALDAAALPVGSYRIKRNSYFNISLNSYAGVAGGFQRYASSVPAGIKKTNGIVGFTAPIGLAFSWGHTKRKDRDSLTGSSSTLFISVVDLGAVTAFRLTHDSTETLPDLKLKNVLAPGIFYVYGIKKLPISVGGGVQYGPQLRSIKDNNAVILPSAWSARIFVAVDIPFFSFFTKTERKYTSQKKEAIKK